MPLKVILVIFKILLTAFESHLRFNGLTNVPFKLWVEVLDKNKPKGIKHRIFKLLGVNVIYP